MTGGASIAHPGASVDETIAAVQARWDRDHDPQALWRVVAHHLRRRIGHRILTISRWHPELRQLERVFSTDEDAYAVGGRKNKPSNPWSNHVLDAGKPHFSPSIDAIRDHFDDFPLLEKLGINAILNVPLLDHGRAIGTMNLMNDRAYSTDEQAIAVRFGGVVAQSVRGQKPS